MFTGQFLCKEQAVERQLGCIQAFFDLAVLLGHEKLRVYDFDAHHGSSCCTLEGRTTTTQLDGDTTALSTCARICTAVHHLPKDHIIGGIFGTISTINTRSPAAHCQLFADHSGTQQHSAFCLIINLL